MPDVALESEWDASKAAANARKHRIAFEEAATAFEAPRSVEIPNPDHSRDEPRFVLPGRGATGRLLVVVHTEREDRVRIISARAATWRERLAYERT